MNKPGALLSKFLPSLEGPGKMSSSDDVPSILLSDDRETVLEKIQKHAYSGGQTSLDEHREPGGNPDVDVSYQFLYYFFEESDERIERLAHEYREGSLLGGELKEMASASIADFLDAHRERREALGSLEAELAQYRLTKEERQNAQRRVGYPHNALVNAHVDQ